MMVGRIVNWYCPSAPWRNSAPAPYFSTRTTPRVLPTANPSAAKFSIALGENLSLIFHMVPFRLRCEREAVKPFDQSCLSSIILSPLNGNVKMSPHETGDIHVESEGTAASERDQRMHQGRHGVCQSRRTPMSERAPN